VRILHKIFPLTAVALLLLPADTVFGENVSDYLRRAKSNINKGDFNGALADYNIAIELKPDLADAHYTLGVLYWQQGEFDQAADQLHAAIQHEPKYAEAHYTLGTVLKQQGKLPEAATSLREALRLQPDLAGAHTTLAAVLRQQGDTAGAAEEAKAAATLSANTTNLQAAEFSTNSGKRLMDAGDLDAAIAQFRAAIQASETYAPAHRQLAQALQRQGHTEEAAKELSRAAELDSSVKPKM